MNKAKKKVKTAKGRGRRGRKEAEEEEEGEEEGKEEGEEEREEEEMEKKRKKVLQNREQIVFFSTSTLTQARAHTTAHLRAHLPMMDQASCTLTNFVHHYPGNILVYPQT